MAIQDLGQLLKSLIQWFSGQSKQKLEEKIQRELTGPGVRAQHLKRKTGRAVTTWVVIYYNEPKPFNIEIGLDTLAYIENLPIVKKNNRLSTHAIHIVRQWYHTYVSPNSKTRKSLQDILLSEEAVFQLVYNKIQIDESWNIIHDVAQLLTASAISENYFVEQHPDISLRDKRTIETMLALRIDRRRMKRLKIQDFTLVETMLKQPEVPKELLYPPALLATREDWENLITMAARRRLDAPTHVVFPRPGEVSVGDGWI